MTTDRQPLAQLPLIREVTMTLPMLPDMEIAASNTVQAMARFMEMPPDKIDEVRLAVVEACVNAFEHSRADDRRVHIQFAVLGEGEPEQLRVTISDSGVGFVPDRVAEPKIEDKINSKHKRGWGLKIMRTLMDHVEIRSNDDGTVIVMTKHR